MNNTLNWYDDNAEVFFESTNDAKMNVIQDAFLELVNETFKEENNQDIKILDYGCGIGRDSLYFKDKGYQVHAIDGSQEMCKFASKKTGLDVKCLDFNDFKEVKQYNAIWACASLLHVEETNIISVMQGLSNALVKDGILYCSFKYGDKQYEKNGRFFNDYDETKFESLMNHVTGLTTIKTFVTNDVRKGREHERWLNVFLKKGD